MTIFLKENEIAILLVGEAVAQNVFNIEKVSCFIILGELEFKIYSNANYIYKYQCAEHIISQILEYYSQVEELFLIKQEISDVKIIGFYSPVKRCCQSTIALELGKQLAKKEKTLYLNFENYIGIPGLIKPGILHDLSDLLYYLENSKDKFVYRLKSSLLQLEELDYIPPLFPSNQLVYITAKQWLSLLQEIKKIGIYKYIILDLNDCMQGLFDILRMCTVVYTVTQDEKNAKIKMQQYRQLLQMCEYTDVLDKTKNNQYPVVREVTDDFYDITKKEVQKFLEDLIQEDLLTEKVLGNEENNEIL